MSITRRVDETSTETHFFCTIPQLSGSQGVGLAFGPSVVGMISDLLAPQYGADSLRWALLICSMANLWAAFHYWRAGVHFPGDLERVAG